MYALGTCTVTSYFLLLMLFITPRTFFVSGVGGGSTFLGLGRRGVIAGSLGGASVIGVGGRPLLQKVAVLTVVVSLTIASALTFRLAKKQYHYHYMDSGVLTAQVLDSLGIRAVRVISTTFLWLAQVQTLIRLFPRHREKVMIKWIGFALIISEVIFTILNNFATTRNEKSYCHAPNVCGTERTPTDVISPLAYLFEMSLSVLYAAWVIFYSICKHRFAFYHPKMRNIGLVAFLSLVAVMVPIVFFALDLSKPNVSPWGEYIRWLGDAAASVVVWEWVERIEALERDEEKDGILGREVYDDDEPVGECSSHEIEWIDSNSEAKFSTRHRSRPNDSDDGHPSRDSDANGGDGDGSNRQSGTSLANRIDWRRFFTFDPIPEPDEAARRIDCIGPVHRSEAGIATVHNTENHPSRRRKGLRLRKVFHRRRPPHHAYLNRHSKRTSSPVSRSAPLQSGIQLTAPGPVLTSPRSPSRSRSRVITCPHHCGTAHSVASSRASSPASTVYRVRYHSIDELPPSSVDLHDVRRRSGDYVVGAGSSSRNDSMTGAGRTETNETTSEGTVVGDEPASPHTHPQRRSIGDG